MLELRQNYDLLVLLKVSGLSRSTFYYQAKVLKADDKYANLKARIRAAYERHKGRYGYRRITAALRQAGEMINHKTVQRLMHVMGLKSLVRPKKYRSYRGQKLYLSPVMDLYNGEIVSYAMQTRPLFSLVGNMLQKALAKLAGQEAPLLHSDQGWPYQMPAYRRQLAEHGLTQSMSRKGNCLDNAAMENFFGTLKSEFFYLNQFDSIEHLQEGLRDYIHYYNHQRIKTKLKGLSPIQYRTQPYST